MNQREEVHAYIAQLVAMSRGTHKMMRDCRNGEMIPVYGDILNQLEDIQQKYEKIDEAIAAR